MRTMWGATALVAVLMIAGCSSNDSPAAAPSQTPATTAAATPTPTPDPVKLQDSCRAALRAEYEAGFAAQGNELPPSAQKPVCTILDRPTIKRLADEAVDEIMGR